MINLKEKSDLDFNNYKSFRNKFSNEIRKYEKLQIDILTDKFRNDTNSPEIGGNTQNIHQVYANTIDITTYCR